MTSHRGFVESIRRRRTVTDPWRIPVILRRACVDRTRSATTTLERVRTFARGALAFGLPTRFRRVGDLEVSAPCARDATEAFVAAREAEERAVAGVETLALFQHRARALVLPLRQQYARLFEERLRLRDGRGVGRCAGRPRHDDRDNDRCLCETVCCHRGAHGRVERDRASSDEVVAGQRSRALCQGVSGPERRGHRRGARLERRRPPSAVMAPRR